jgi:hypothetical protein
MGRSQRRIDETAFEHLVDQLEMATARFTDEQLLDLADSLHATLRRRRQGMGRAANEQRSFED